ncbi:MAG: divalent-cation tolerance protein CutA [Rhodospirillales bacterium]
MKNRLCACANVLQGTTSIYRWEGAINEDEEVSLLLKTREDLVEQVVENVREIHSYDCPCVVSIPITGGNRAFLDWIDAQTKT